MKHLLRRLEKSPSTWFLLTTSFLFFLLRLPSLFEPYWYGDEGVYEVVGKAIDHGRMLYTGIWDNKPPFLYLTYALVDGNQFGAKLLSLLFGLGAVFVFFFVAKRLFRTNSLIFLTTAIFAFLFATPLIEGNIANAENFMLFPILLAALLIWNTTHTTTPSSFNRLLHIRIRNDKRIIGHWSFSIGHFLAGLLLGIAFLYKVVAVFDFAAFWLFLVYCTLPTKTSLRHMLRKETLLFLLQKTGSYVIGFFLPLVITLCYFSINHAAGTFLQSAFTSNVGYVGYGNQLFIPQGWLLLKLTLLLVVILWLWTFREKITKPLLFILLWLAFSLFDSFFSQRAYTHYFLMTISSGALAIGLLLQQVKPFGNFLKLLVVIGLVGGYLYFVGNRYAGVFPYYANYINFLTSRITVTQYQSFFDKKVPRDYELADYLRLHTTPGESIFIWGDSPQIYALSDTLPVGRYTVAYHITSIKTAEKETNHLLQTNPPIFVVVLSDASAFPFSLNDYNAASYSFNNNIIYERTN